MDKAEYDKAYRERDYVKEKRRLAGRVHYQKHKERLKTYQKEYLSRPETKAIVSTRAKKYYKDRPKYYMLARAKQRARRDGLPFDLTIEDIYIPELCPVFNIPLLTGVVNQSNNSPSLDKINPKLGYIKGNVCVISNAANFRKSDMTIEQCEALLKYMKRAI